ncbi:hypothetical protein [Sanguibacter sp. HDW7]|uniref:hypothetical protein n=1 Tax=Sanguibacter sp. HDW7 TaxID=2714931 RepID=UPI00140C0D09|nr:hypothetical protein [Sanguibacter sp. HDW7]QIK82391.1 hypothetical protein G7063_01265 [Sanguibacter sp. HDW7]
MPTGADGVLTATWRPEAAAVSLEVLGSAWSSAVVEVRVMRLVAGESDVPVRGADRVPAVGGYWAGSDHEQPLGSSVTYQAIGYTAAGVAVLSSMVTVSTEGAPHGIWLKAAGRPNLTVRGTGRASDGPVSQTQGGVYDVIGGTGVAVASVAGVNASTYSLVVSSEDAGVEASIRALLSTTRVVLVQDCGHDVIESGWYYVSQVSRAPRDPQYLLPGRVHTLSLTRTGVPAGGGQGVIGWSWAAVTATYPTWSAAMAAHPTWFDLTRGA